MNERPGLTLSAKLFVLGLVAAAAGILTLFLTGWISQSIPVGTILLLMAAGLVTFGRWRWTLVSSLVLTIFIFVMGFIAPGLCDRLSHPTVVSAFVGTWVQELGLVIALVFGSIANAEWRRISQ